MVREQIFSDNEGNHLMVALDFYDNRYKQTTLYIPEEYSDIEIVDISISKVYVDRPIHYSVFMRLSSWLMEMFDKYPDAIFTYICSTDELETNHNNLAPQMYRWRLFDMLYKRSCLRHGRVNIQDILIGPEGYQSSGRAFYRDKHSPIVHIVTAHLQEKQQEF